MSSCDEKKTQHFDSISKTIFSLRFSLAPIKLKIGFCLNSIPLKDVCETNTVGASNNRSSFLYNEQIIYANLLLIDVSTLSRFRDFSAASLRLYFSPPFMLTAMTASTLRPSAVPTTDMIVATVITMQHLCNKHMKHVFP